MVERSAVNRLVVGSNPTAGANFDTWGVRRHVAAFRFAFAAFIGISKGAGWSSLVARQAHNLKVAGSNPAPATNSFAACRQLIAFTFSKTVKVDSTSASPMMSREE